MDQWYKSRWTCPSRTWSRSQDSKRQAVFPCCFAWIGKRPYHLHWTMNWLQTWPADWRGEPGSKTRMDIDEYPGFPPCQSFSQRWCLRFWEGLRSSVTLRAATKAVFRASYWVTVTMTGWVETNWKVPVQVDPTVKWVWAAWVPHVLPLQTVFKVVVVFFEHREDVAIGICQWDNFEVKLLEVRVWCKLLETKTVFKLQTSNKI